MNDYIPPCDTYREEDFEFVGTIEEIDPDTGDILYGVRENKRCESCFLREACIAEVMKLLQKEYGVGEGRIQLEGGDQPSIN